MTKERDKTDVFSALYRLLYCLDSAPTSETFAPVSKIDPELEKNLDGQRTIKVIIQLTNYHTDGNQYPTDTVIDEFDRMVPLIQKYIDGPTAISESGLSITAQLPGKVIKGLANFEIVRMISLDAEVGTTLDG